MTATAASIFLRLGRSRGIREFGRSHFKPSAILHLQRPQDPASRNGDKRRTAKYGVKSQGTQTNSIVKMATQSPAEYYRSRGVFNDKHTVDKELMKKIQG